jgi:hypothetical protein
MLIPPAPCLNPPRLFAFKMLTNMSLKFIDLGRTTYYALPFFPIVMAILETPTPLNTVGSNKVTPEAPKSLSPASIDRYSEGSK